MSVKPFCFWHDATVSGHLILCGTGLRLLRYIQWELREPKLSMPRLVQLLARIRGVLVRGPVGTEEMVLEPMNRKEALVLSKLNLGRFISSMD